MVSAVIAKGALNVARTAAPAARSQAVRALSSSAVSQKDFVQDIYLRELKSYKAPAKASDAHIGQVREFHAPTPPQAPSVPSSSELSSELDAYAKSEPDHAVRAAEADKGAITESGDVQAYLREAAADVHVEAHH